MRYIIPILFSWLVLAPFPDAISARFIEAEIMAIELDHQGNLEKSRQFFDGKYLIPDGPGSTDGMAVHPSDFLFVSIPNGLGILSPEGELPGKIALGQVTNMALNDTFSHLFITSPKKLMRLKINSLK